MLFDGKAFARVRLRALQEERKVFGPLRLGIVVSSADSVTASYVKIKERNAAALDIELVRFPVSEQASQAEVEAVVREANGCDGVIVQLPLPAAIDADAIVNAMDIAKDVDVISKEATARFARGESPVMPPVAAAIARIIDAEGIAIKGKAAVVVGKGKLVGEPSRVLLESLGARVTALGKGDALFAHTRDADIIVLGTGVPSLLEPNMVKSGVSVFDAGTSESGGAVVGDADPRVAEKASFFTPVPGGIGPVAVVEIFGNLLILEKSQHEKRSGDLFRR